ncbi:MAG: ribosome maturation factor RimP [Microthrixaceae bacterium]
MSITDRVQSLVVPILDELGVDLYDVTYHGGTLRVAVTRHGGVDLDTVAEVSRRVSRELDLEDPIAARYTLEVTSPGVERTLRTAAQWRLAVGETARVRLRAGRDGERSPRVQGLRGPMSPGDGALDAVAVAGSDRRIEGIVRSVSERGAEIDVTGVGPVVVDFADVDRARTVFEWGVPTTDKGHPARRATRDGSRPGPVTPSTGATPR